MPEMTMLPTKVDWSDIDQQKRIVGYVKDRLDAARTRADPFKRSALIDFQNFCQVSSVFGYNHHMVEPMTLESVNSTEESVMANVFGKERFFDLRALDGQNAVKVEKNRERLLRALRSAKWKMKYFKWADDAVKFGRGEMLTVACPWWDRRQTDEPMSDGQGFDLTLGRQRSQTNAIRVRPEFVNVSFWNQLPYPYEGYPDVQDAPFHACWIDYPLATIRAMKFQPWAMWMNTEQIKGDIEVDTGSRSVAQSTYDYEFASQRLALSGWNILDDATQGSNCVRHGRVFYYWEAPPGGSGCRAWAVISEDKLLVCRGSDYDHVQKPIDSLRWIPIDATNLYYCFGVPGTIRSYQDRQNLTLSQKYEMRDAAMHPTKLAGPGFPVTELSKLLAPTGSLIHFDSGDPSQLTDFDRPPSRPDLFDDEESVRQGVARSTKQTDINTGSQDPGNVGLKAYASLALLSKQAKQAMVFRVLFFEEGGAVPQLEKTNALLNQLAPDTERIPLTDHNDTLAKAGVQGGFDFTQDDQTGAYEFYAVGSSMTLEGPELAGLAIPFFEKAATTRDIGQRLDMSEIYQRVGRWLFGQSINWSVLTPEEFQRKQQENPPPLPIKLTGSLKDFDPEARAEAERRMGLPVSAPQPGKAEVEQLKQNELTKREIIKHALKAPRVVPRQEVMAPV